MIPFAHEISPEEIKYRERKVGDLIKRFSQKPKELIKNITVEDLIDRGSINPYLVKALCLKDIDECVEYILVQRVGRSLVTSFGFTLEEFIAIILGGRQVDNLCPVCRSRIKKEDKPWCCWWDVVIQKPFEEEGKKFKGILISVKSGPMDMNKDQTEHFAERAKTAESHYYKPYQFFVYGKTPSNIVVKTLRDEGLDPKKYLKVGKEIFEEFFDNSEYFKDALELFKREGLEMNLFDLIEVKKSELTNELKTLYPQGLDSLLEDTLKGEEPNFNN